MIERMRGGTRQNDGLETGIMGAAAAKLAWGRPLFARRGSRPPSQTFVANLCRCRPGPKQAHTRPLCRLACSSPLPLPAGSKTSAHTSIAPPCLQFCTQRASPEWGPCSPTRSHSPLRSTCAPLCRVAFFASVLSDQTNCVLSRIKPRLFANGSLKQQLLGQQNLSRERDSSACATRTASTESRGRTCGMRPLWAPCWVPATTATTHAEILKPQPEIDRKLSPRTYWGFHMIHQYWILHTRSISGRGFKISVWKEIRVRI